MDEKEMNEEQSPDGNGGNNEEDPGSEEIEAVPPIDDINQGEEIQGLKKEIETLKQEIRKLKRPPQNKMGSTEQLSDEDEENNAGDQESGDAEGEISRDETNSGDVSKEIIKSTEVALKLEIRKLKAQMRSEEVRTANQNRRTILKFILSLFAIWIVVSLIHLQFTGDIQMLTAGAAILSGPLGVVIGYYYAKEDKDSSKQSQS